MSLYLKYRPNDFDNLMWQSFVKDTLKKAIAEDKTVGAYLLCGPRWTGKTSTARLLAKTINCTNQKDWNPCLECSVCKDFADERLTDIIEIDAASHTWVDNIREIIERAQFSPIKTKYKIYIVDEVHMLSKWAFNALLKILEEPPKHVKFILATTETHKVPETIISRCQRYDFKRISDIDVWNRLKFISEKEGIKVDDKSYQYIIDNSNWGLRNAISLYEQLIVDSEINFEILVEKLWIISSDKIESFLWKLLDSDKTIIEDLDKIVSDWKNIKLFFKDLIFYTKNKALNELKLWNDISKYINILDILDDTFWKTKTSLDENITFTVWLLKIISNYSSKNIPQVETKTVTASVTQKKVVQTNVVKQEVSHDDIADVFWMDEPSGTPVQKETISNNFGWDFDLNSFIVKLKENWSKWSLNMALRGSEVWTNWDNLVIHPKTKIAKVNVENVENIALMNKSLWDMWLTTYSVIIK